MTSSCRKLCELSLLLILSTSFLLSACVQERLVTERPEYAYPQNLINLCGKAWQFTVDNVGQFKTPYLNNDDKQLLLSSQLLPIEVEQSLNIKSIQLTINTQGKTDLMAEYASGQQIEYPFP